MVYMDNENFEQQELFKQEKYISDLLEQKTPKNKSSLNTIFGSSILTSIIVLSFLYVYGIFDENEIIIPDPVTITETVTETEVIMPRIDSTPSINKSWLVASRVALVAQKRIFVAPRFEISAPNSCTAASVRSIASG